MIRPREWELDESTARKKIIDFAAEHGWPLFVKPARAGSSIGITKVDVSGLDEAIPAARRHDPKFLVEALLRGREIECGVLEFEDGPPGLRTGRDPAGAVARLLRLRGEVHRLDARLPPRSPRTDREVRRLAVEAFDAAACEGLVRADFFLTEDGTFVINEINTMPGFTPSPCTRRCGRRRGCRTRSLVDRLIQAALRRPTGLR